MIEIHKETVGQIPVLHAVESGKMKERLPFVIFVHGFTSAKEHNLHFAYLLAEKGFRVVLPDAILHGERSEKDGGSRLIFSFWDIVAQNIHDLNLIKRNFEDRNLITDDIGVAGTSMGGITLFGALAQFDWIRAGVSLMGSPAYERLARGQIAGLRQQGIDIPLSENELEETYAKLSEFDISKEPGRLNGRPLLIWHGQKDHVVPYAHAHDFYKAANEEYKGQEDKICFISDKEAGHKVSREALLETVKWFKRFLMN